MIIFLSGSAVAAIVLAVVLILGGATPSISNILNIIVNNSIILFILSGIASVLSNFSYIDEVNIKNKIQEVAYLITGSISDLFLGVGFLTVAIVEIQVSANAASDNPIGFVLLLPIGIAEMCFLLLVFGGLSYLISNYLANLIILKLAAAIIFFALSIGFITLFYPATFASLFEGTPIDIVSSWLLALFGSLRDALAPLAVWLYENFG